MNQILSISRRLVLASVLILASFSQAFAAGPGNPSARVYDADVIVVGSGLAGHGAVYGALDRGAKVLLLEKNDRLGGTSFTATGTYAAVGTAIQKAKGIVDSKELFVKDVNRIGHGMADQDLLAKFVEESTAVWEWFVASGLPVNPSGPVIDPVHSPYSVARTTTPVKNSANEYVRILAEQSRAKYAARLTALVNTTVTGLVKENDRVVGVRAKSGAEERTFYAKAVVLATGGYGSNREMIKKYSPRYAEYRTVTPGFATGEGIEMAKAAGAKLVNMDYIVGYFGAMPLNANSYALGFGDLTSGFAEGWKGEIWVDAKGKRFVDEDESDEDIRETAIQTVVDGKMLVVFDQGIMEKNGGKTPIRTFDARMAEGYSVKKAATLEALASAFGVDPAGLKATVEAVNASVAAKKPDAFGKTTGMAFAKGPYYGVLSYATIFMTQGGVKVDTKLRAVGEDGKPIPGLYAAGEVMGTTQWGGYGYAGGTGNAPAIVFGLDAGKEAAAFALGD
jgi:flavocytochrome c